jgi:hypothetical protein
MIRGADREHVAQRLDVLLQETDRSRQLDSLDMVVVRSFLRAQGIAVEPDAGPETGTIAGWIAWLEQRTAAG